MRWKERWGWLILGVTMAASVVAAEPIAPDRPDFTDGTLIVSPGYLQVEGGVTRSQGGGTSETVLPELTLRFAVSEEMELRFGWDGWSEQSGGGDVVRGINDMSVGAKALLLGEEAQPLRIGVLAATSVPIGSSSLTSDAWDPLVKLLWSYSLGDDYQLSGNLVAARPTENGVHYAQRAQSLELGADLSEQTSIYLEYFGMSRETLDGPSTHYLDMGLTTLLSEDSSIDVRFGKGLNRAASGWFSGVGMAMRF